ncbi:helix-turn-helix domain-containing protein [Desulfovibrio sp. OttesenSCG-928-M14]|nr:helix-turn-helix domain-containing protein [Desulfovibrio sp. OttesenSCG-928-M14]
MSMSYNYPVLTDNGRATHVMIPIEDFERWLQREKRRDRVKIPEDVAYMVADGMNPVRAWRKYKKLTQAELAARIGVSRPAFAQSEKNGVKPRRETIRKAAQALDLDPRQIFELYDDEPLSDDGFVMPSEENF